MSYIFTFVFFQILSAVSASLATPLLTAYRCSLRISFAERKNGIPVKLNRSLADEMILNRIELIETWEPYETHVTSSCIGAFPKIWIKKKND